MIKGKLDRGSPLIITLGKAEVKRVLKPKGSFIFDVRKELAKKFFFAKQLNSMARQAHAERAWLAVKRFYKNCRDGVKPVGYPKFKKHSRSVNP